MIAATLQLMIGVARTTVYSIDPVLAENPLPPPYSALMIWVPGVIDAIVMLALPAFNVTAAPTGWPSRRKRTVPAGALPAAATTVAPNVTACPNAELPEAALTLALVVSMTTIVPSTRASA